MTSLWFVVPCHGRTKLAQICLRQLRRTCDALTDYGIYATAVVIADDANLKTARKLGFATVRRDNRFLSRKFNDGIQLAMDRRHNPHPADYVVPIGSDDWVDWRILTTLPAPNSIRCFQRISFVREDGLEMIGRHLDYMGGCGIRVYPRDVMERCGYRPADEDRTRACDTSILTNIINEYEQRIPRRQLKVIHAPSDARQIVDWKSPDVQVTSYEALRRHKKLAETDPFTDLAEFFPAESLDEMAAHYSIPARSLAVA